MVGQVDLQHLQTAVDGLDQTEAADQGVHGSEAADGDAATAFSNFRVDVASRHHGLRAAAQVGPVQTAFDATFAVGQFPSYDRFHSKLLGGGGRERGGTPSQTTKTPGDFEFFHASAGRNR